ncbi:hypothetical protein COU60_01290 [Candidatus Pacearchaeota archaeon CG10_big_fil_rev_8_21_14_0_10_34_76]|nr:MAG: hypothetical protein COU60_01290 [Candidatus Pacearchaeota archaeon CG10_big_fil_rev_8_21_14_0_10_34_76]
MNDFQKQINDLKIRNKRVEADKAWETSRSRKISIILLTYIVIVITFYILNLPKPFLNAIIPSLAFFLSTLSIPILKKWWINNIYK